MELALKLAEKDLKLQNYYLTPIMEDMISVVYQKWFLIQLM
jgi:hypothetical protein